MGFFSKKGNEMLTAQLLKIIQDCVRIVNSTKKPDTYFERYDLLEKTAGELSTLKGVKFKGEKPADLLQQIKNKKQDNIHDMIERYFEDVSLKAEYLKTVNAKRNKYYMFITTLEDYYSVMDNNNIEYTKTLYSNAISVYQLAKM